MRRSAKAPAAQAVRRPRHPRAQQAEETAQAILQAALVCFNRNGSEYTSIEDIAREAGVSRPLVHYHFRTKDDLLVRVQHQLFEALSDRVREAAARLGPSPAHVGWGLDQVWNLMKLARPFVPTVMDQVGRAGRDESVRGQFRELLDRNRRLITEVVRAVLATQGTAMDARLPALATLLIAALSGLLMLTTITTAEDVDAAYGELRRLLLGVAPEVSGMQAGEAPGVEKPHGE